MRGQQQEPRYEDFAILAPTEALAEVLIAGVAAAQATDNCEHLNEADVTAYITATADDDACGLIREHIVQCQPCRIRIHSLVAAIGATSGGPAFLQVVQKTFDVWPQAATVGLSALSDRINALLVSDAYVPYSRASLRLARFASHGEPAGEVVGFVCEDGPGIDRDHHFHLLLRAKAASVSDGDVTICLRDDSGTIILKTVELVDGRAQICVDLSAVAVRPGPIQVSSVGGRYIAQPVSDTDTADGAVETSEQVTIPDYIVENGDVQDQTDAEIDASARREEDRGHDK